MSLKALDGLFYMVGQEEQEIRTNPAAQVTPLASVDSVILVLEEAQWMLNGCRKLPTAKMTRNRMNWPMTAKTFFIVMARIEFSAKRLALGYPPSPLTAKFLDAIRYGLSYL